jgi:hypothetical protein
VNSYESNDSAREPLRIEDAARAYGNRPTTQEAIQLSKLFIRDTKHNDLLDSLKWAFDATKTRPGEYESTTHGEQIKTGKTWKFTPRYNTRMNEKIIAIDFSVDNSIIDADYTVVGSEPEKPTTITEGDIFVDETQWNKLMRMLRERCASQDNTPPPKRHWSDGLERQRRHKPK